MPARILGGTGFFGKLPASGDFVARNVPQGLRPVLDRWLTRHLADMARRPEVWPADGLRGIWMSAGFGPISTLILPSHDASGRCFPLAFCVECEGVDQPGVNTWADAVLSRVNLSMPLVELSQRLEDLPGPVLASKPLVPPLFWADGKIGPIESLIRL